jgi:hypothetical protein
MTASVGEEEHFPPNQVWKKLNHEGTKDTKKCEEESEELH